MYEVCNISIKYSKVILTGCIFFSLVIRFKQHSITIIINK